MVLSGYGLSAFLFSSLAHAIFPGNTSAFILLLALGTSLPMIIGFFLVRPIPLPAYEIIGGEDYDIIDDAYVGGIDVSAIFKHNNESRALLLSNLSEDQPSSSSSHAPIESSLLSNNAPFPEPSSLRDSSPEDSPHHPENNKHRHPFRRTMQETLPNIHGRQLWRSGKFWLAFVILSLCGYFYFRSEPELISIPPLVSGTGVMCKDYVVTRVDRSDELALNTIFRY